MSTPLQIGITGGIGSGKSLVCKIFSKLGTPIYDADSRAKFLMTTDGILIEQIKKEFGTLSYNSEGELNRLHLSKTVFNNPKQLEKLNQLVHPRVGEDYERWVKQLSGHSYCLKEAALLFESGSYKQLDKVIVVVAEEDQRIKRVLKRDPQRNEEEIRRIIRNQIPQEEKVKMAGYIIKNDDTELLIPQVLELHQRFSHTN